MIRGTGVLFFKRSDHLHEHIMYKEKWLSVFLKEAKLSF